MKKTLLVLAKVFLCISMCLTSYSNNILRSDGRVVVVGDDSKNQCDVSKWTDVILITAGFDYTIGLKKYGTVLAAGDETCGECDVRSWVLKNN